MSKPTTPPGPPTQPGPEPQPQPLSPPVYGVIGAAVLALASTDATRTPAATMTETAPNDEQEPTAEPTAAGFTRRKSDFEIGIKILEKKCFGSAVCSVTLPDQAQGTSGHRS